MNPLAIITGVGPGTGAALARRFHLGGYRVAMLARDGERLAKLQAELPGAIAVACDVADPAALSAALARIEAEAGPPKGGDPQRRRRGLRVLSGDRTCRAGAQLPGQTSWPCCTWPATWRRRWSRTAAAR
jgi:NAD(P)-dependent dehydrogenase (short-subunit alcohol dehydrogenase family)